MLPFSCYRIGSFSQCAEVRIFWGRAFWLGGGDFIVSQYIQRNEDIDIIVRNFTKLMSGSGYRSCKKC